MWWKKPGLWFVTQWLRGLEPPLLFHKVIGLPGGSEDPWGEVYPAWPLPARRE